MTATARQKVKHAERSRPAPWEAVDSYRLRIYRTRTDPRVARWARSRLQREAIRSPTTEGCRAWKTALRSTPATFQIARAWVSDTCSLRRIHSRDWQAARQPLPFA